MSIDTICN